LGVERDGAEKESQGNDRDGMTAMGRCGTYQVLLLATRI
jgi:hypothetical protein